MKQRFCKGLLVIRCFHYRACSFLQPPDPETWNGEPRGYYVLYRQADLPNFSEKKLNVTDQEAILDDLFQFVNYEVRVLAYNDKGRGPASTPANIYVGEAGEMLENGVDEIHIHACIFIHRMLYTIL